MPKSAEDKKWEAEDDMRTLARAEEVKKDPKRLKAAKAMAAEKIKDLQKVKDAAK